MESKDPKNVIVKCTDNCSCLSIDKWDDEPIYYVTFYKSYTGLGFFARAKEIFLYLIGRRDIIGTEVLLDESDFEKIRNFK